MTATIENLYTGNNSTTDYSFTFPYLDTSDIKVTLATVATTAYSLLNATTVRFDSAPGNGVAIRIYRETAFDTPKATFYPGSAIRANDLNDNTLQNLYVNQESNDKVADAWLSGDPTVISTESWYTTDDTKVATTKAIEGRIDAKIDTALTGDIAAGNKITITDNSPSSGQITVALTSGSLVNSDVNASAAIAGTKITPSFGSQNVSTSGTLASGAATVTGNIAVSGTVDGRDVAADGSKLDGIETNATADQTNAEIRAAVEAASDSNVFTDADHTKLNDIESDATRDQTAAEIRTLVENATDSNVFTDADHTKLNGIETAATADQTDAEIRAAVENATDSNVFTDADHTKLNGIETAATADQTASEIKTLLQSDKLTASEIADSTITSTQIATGALDGRYYTETELTGGALDGRYYTETESDARYFNISTGDTIKDGDTFPDNDTTIATTAAINDRIIDLVDDVGGFVPIANETSFPAANPDVNNGAGTLVSIKALANNLTSNGSGVATIANGAGSGNTVTINGLANSTTYAATFGMIVETTSTLHTYTFHRQVPKATEVSTVAGSISNVNAVGGNISNVNTVAGNNSNITTVAGANSNITSVAGSISNVNTVATNISSVNDFAARYRVASSAPSSSLDTGDLYFDTSANELKVYNGSSWQGGVTATGNLAGLGANTFTGNQSLGDNNKVIFGTGSDLQIYHDGSHSYITDTGTGRLHINTSQLRVNNAADNEILISATENGATELYYDGSKKLYTYADGAKIEGDFIFKQADGTTKASWNGTNNYIKVNDSVKFVAGTGDDLRIYHDPSNGGNIIDAATSENVWIKNNAGSANEAMGAFRANGSSELYYDGSKKFHTHSTGVTVTGYLHIEDGSTGIGLGNSDDLKLYHDGSNSNIKNDTGWLNVSAGGNGFSVGNGDFSENLFKATNNGSVDLYYDNSKKFETDANGVTITGTTTCNGDVHFDGNTAGRDALWDRSDNCLHFQDNAYLKIGTGTDLQIYHDGSHSWVKNTTGNVVVHTGTGHFKVWSGSNEDMIDAAPNGAVKLTYDDSLKLETTSGGINVTGAITVNGSALASGNTITGLMADGAIGNLKPVKAQSNGKIGEIKLVDSAATYPILDGSGTIDGGNTWAQGACKIADNLAVYTYIDGGNGKVKVGSLSSTATSYGNITFGSEYEYEDGDVVGNPCLARISDTKFAVVWLKWAANSSDWKFQAKIGTISGTTVSWGTTATVKTNVSNAFRNNFINYGCIWDSNASRLVVSYVPYYGGDEDTYARLTLKALSVSGTSITVPADSTETQVGTYEGGTHRWAYDTQRNCGIIFERSVGYYGHGQMHTITTSGSTCTVQDTIVAQDSIGVYMDICYDATNNRAVYVMESSSYIKMNAVTIDSSYNMTKINDTASNIQDNSDTGTPNKPQVEYVSAIGKYLMICGNNDNRVSGHIVSFNSSDDTFSGQGFDNITQLHSSNNTTDIVLFEWRDGVFGAVFETTGNGDTVGLNIKTTLTASTLTDADQFIGFADGAISDGSTSSTIATYGNSLNGFSGLTGGTVYYVQGDGSLATTKDSTYLSTLPANTPCAGLALSDSRLLIRDPLAKT